MTKSSAEDAAHWFLRRQQGRDAVPQSDLKSRNRAGLFSARRNQVFKFCM
jgi:hypothetical protein